MRGLALTARTLPPIPPNGLLGWKDMPPAAQHRGHKPPLGARRVIEGERGTEGREGDRRGPHRARLGGEQVGGRCGRVERGRPR